MQKRSRFRYVVGTLLVGYWLAACIPPVASAQTVAPSSDSPALEEIIVTARRREENIQSVPIAITVVSQQALQENNVQTFGDLQYLVPSMSASTGTSRDAPNVS